MTPTPCVPCCSTPQVVNTPGVEGLPGTNGTNGTNGVDGFTITTANFTVPVTGNTVTVAVLNSSWMVIGQTLIIGQGAGAVLANPGPMTCTVVSIPSSTTVQVRALGQAGDVPSGSTISSGAIVSTSGFGSVLATVTVYTGGSGTFTPGTNTKTLRVECIGGGGSGGGSDGGANASAASGGGGGGYSATFVTSLAASYAYAVGAGGVAPAAGANPGNAGGDTTFGAVCTAKGGSGGGAGAAAGTSAGFVIGGAGGSAAAGVGDVKASGNAGRAAQRVSGTVGLASGGGGSHLGGGGPDSSTAGAGAAGQPYGGGGGGGLALAGSATTAGGAGAAGLIIVSEYS